MKIHKLLAILTVLCMFFITACNEDNPLMEPEEMISEPGSVTIRVEGEDDYFIPGCDLVIDTIVGWGSGLDTNFIEVYYFSTTDFFQDNPQGSGEEVYYEIELYNRYVPTAAHPDIPNYAPPIGPNVNPTVSAGAPFYFDFNATDHEVIVDNETELRYVLETAWTSGSATGQSTFKRFENGVEESLFATVVVEFIK